jgi:hypothetical protein
VAKPAWRRIAGYLGEYLREAAVLVLVFALLDRVVNDKTLTKGWIVATIFISLLGWASGVWFSLKGDDENE